MAIVHLHCFSCGQELEFTDRVGFREECEKCGEDVHCCKNCAFYDLNSYNECREPSAEVVREKDRSNYCDYFQPRTDKGSENKKRDDLLAAAELLFKKK